MQSAFLTITTWIASRKSCVRLLLYKKDVRNSTILSKCSPIFLLWDFSGPATWQVAGNNSPEDLVWKDDVLSPDLSSWPDDSDDSWICDKSWDTSSATWKTQITRKILGRIFFWSGDVLPDLKELPKTSSPFRNHFGADGKLLNDLFTSRAIAKGAL